MKRFEKKILRVIMAHGISKEKKRLGIRPQINFSANRHKPRI